MSIQKPAEPKQSYPIAAQIQTTSTIPLGGLLLLTMSLVWLVGEMSYFLMKIVKTESPLKGGNIYYAALVCYGLIGIGSILILFFCIMELLAKLKPKKLPPSDAPEKTAP